MPPTGGSLPAASEEPTPGDPTCIITVQGETSSKIGTVGIVTFTADVTVNSAKIEFQNTAGGPTFSAPVDLSDPNHRTLLLGMKPDATYSYKVIVNDTCVSETKSLTTGIRPTTAPGGERLPRIVKSGSGTAQAGFYVLSILGSNAANVIIDQDGDTVWWAGGVAATEGTGRAKMDWDGKYMWAIAANPFPGAGSIRRVSMDGLEDTTDLPGTEFRHHDLAALPGGVMTMIAHQAAASPTCTRIFEHNPDGTTKEIVADVNSLYKQVNDCHTNSIHYHPDEDVYTLGDREASLFVKMTRDGEVVWQLGGSDPVGPSFAGIGKWKISHGHHFFEQEGQLRMLVFNNSGDDTGGAAAGPGGTKVREFALDEAAMTASEIWSLGVDSTTIMGDAQRLPNGNTLITLTTKGAVREYGPGDTLINEFNTGTQVGYVDYRPTLYGMPAKAHLDFTNFDK